VDGESIDKPLVVDLDGTLLRTDVFIESMLLYAGKGAMNVFEILVWATKGKAPIKEQLSQRVSIDVENLPYNEQLVSFLRSQKKNKRRIVLATASHQLYAAQIADYLSLFDLVLATSGDVNLSHRNKRDKLIALYGENGFDYIGNSHDDIAVWLAADRAYLANPDPGVRRRAERIGNIEKVFLQPKGSVWAWIKILRPEQWIGNLAVFVPLLLTQQFSEVALWLLCFLAWIVLSLASTGSCVLSDLLNIDVLRDDDPAYPFASGDVPVQSGLLAGAVAVLCALCSSMFYFSFEFALLILFFFLIGLVTYHTMKRYRCKTVFRIICLYSVRIIAGFIVVNLFAH